MGILTLKRALMRPLQRGAHQVNAKHAQILSQISRRSALKGLASIPAAFHLLGVSEDQQTANRSGLWFPEDLDENELSTYPCDPNSGDQLYKDAYHPLNQNPVVLGAGALQLAQENRRRSSMFIVNVGITGVLVSFGFIATSTVYTLPLAACASANDGSGGVIVDEVWKGTVWAIPASGATSGTVLFTELLDLETR